MSHYRWPVFVAIFAGCGWLPTAVAQTDYGTPPTQPGQVSLGFEEPDLPPASMAARWDDRWQAITPDTGSRGNLIRGLGADTTDAREMDRPGVRPRRESAPRVAQLQGNIDVSRDRRADRIAQTVPPPINAADGTPARAPAAGSQFSPGQRNYYGQQAEMETAIPREKKFSTGPNSSSPIIGEAPEMPRRIATDNSSNDGFGDASGQTRNTSLAAETAQSPSTPAATPNNELGADAEDAMEGAEQVATTQSVYWLPLMMGLFASVAANLFFGWVAWDAHAKYQDLVDDISESEARLTPSSRARDRHPTSARRERRSIDEADLAGVGLDRATS